MSAYFVVVDEFRQLPRPIRVAQADSAQEAVEKARAWYDTRVGERMGEILHVAPLADHLNLVTTRKSAVDGRLVCRALDECTVRTPEAWQATKTRIEANLRSKWGTEVRVACEFDFVDMTPKTGPYIDRFGREIERRAAAPSAPVYTEPPPQFDRFGREIEAPRPEAPAQAPPPAPVEPAPTVPYDTQSAKPPLPPGQTVQGTPFPDPGFGNTQPAAPDLPDYDPGDDSNDNNSQ